MHYRVPRFAPAAISFQQTPNEGSARRLFTRSQTHDDEDVSAGSPVLGRRIDYHGRFAAPDFGRRGPSPLGYSVYSSDGGKRSRRHNSDGADDGRRNDEGRLLSPSAFSRISETLGALNMVGNFLVNFTRGDNGGGGHHQQHHHQAHGLPGNSDHSIDHLDAEALSDERPMQMISSSSSSSSAATSMPDAILTLTKNVTKTIEPLIKRVGQMTKVETQEKPSISDRIDVQGENKRKKHETSANKAGAEATTALAPGKLSIARPAFIGSGPL